MSPTGLPNNVAVALSVPTSHRDSVTTVIVSGDPLRFRAQCTFCDFLGPIQPNAALADADVLGHRADLYG